jgi:hypothetical protein
LAACSPADPGNDFRRGRGHRMDRDLCLQFLQEMPALLGSLRCVRPINAMPEFGDSKSGDHEIKSTALTTLNPSLAILLRPSIILR